MRLSTFAALGSAAMLAGAFGFQHLGDMAPCKLCLWQRWPHAIAFGLGLLALAWPWIGLRLAGLGAMLAGAGIALYHTGVERRWWEGPQSCTSSGVEGLSTDALLDQIMRAPIVRCDEVPWELFGLSMASWNALASVGLALLWAASLRRG